MDRKYWEEEIETMSREKLHELQLQRLKRFSSRRTRLIIRKYSFNTELPPTAWSRGRYSQTPFYYQSGHAWPLSFRAGGWQYGRRRCTHSFSSRQPDSLDSDRSFATWSRFMGKFGCPLFIYGRHTQNRCFSKTAPATECLREDLVSVRRGTSRMSDGSGSSGEQ